MEITFELIGDLYYIIFNKKYRHFRGFNSIQDLLESRDYKHYIWQYKLNKK